MFPAQSMFKSQTLGKQGDGKVSSEILNIFFNKPGSAVKQNDQGFD